MLDFYRRLPNWAAVVMAGIIALMTGILLGVPAGIVGMFFYDRGTSKGDDLAVLQIGFFAVAGFASVLMSSWLLSRHHSITTLVPSVALGAWLAFTTFYCWGSAKEYGNYYTFFIISGWFITFVALVTSWLLSYKLFVRETAQ